MAIKTATISISTEAFDEFQVAMKAAGLDTMPDQLVIKRDTNITQPIDFRLATIRRDCLIEAVKYRASNPLKTVSDPDVISLAGEMYDFVTGKEVEPKTGGWK